MSLTFCFNSKFTKIKTGIIVNFIFWGSSISSNGIPEATIKMWSKNIANKMQEKNVKEFFFEKIKD